MNSLKNTLQQGKPITGTMITLFDNPDLIRILKECGFDFFILDCEHGYFDYGKAAGLFAMAREAGLPGLVRIPEVRREHVLKYMEMGSKGFLLPGSETVEQAKALVEYAKYYPLGSRGVSLLRAHTGYAQPSSAKEYMEKANAECLLILQIESVKGVENIDSLLDIEGVDAAFIGPNDLTQSMGIMGQTDHPLYMDAVHKVIAAAKARGKYSGIHLMSAEALKPWLEKGMTLNLWANDVVMLMNAAREGLKKVKEYYKSSSGSNC